MLGSGGVFITILDFPHLLGFFSCHSVVNVWFSGDVPKKRKRGRPSKSETLARRQAESEEAERRKAAKVKVAESGQAEEEEDDIMDAGAIDDPEGQ